MLIEMWMYKFQAVELSRVLFVKSICVQLPDKRTYVAMLKVARKNLRFKCLRIPNSERGSFVGPGHNIIAFLIRYELIGFTYKRCSHVYEAIQVAR
mmetsp:Transcript_19696/g.24884  ORF Transcript_19696/g.24884 Transcript_19696/m.24884 type:complete len:96 (-) Transcript_19696:18-305(-)